MVFALVAAAVFVVDRVTKIAVSQNVAFGSERLVLPHVWITNTENAGAAFGVAQSGTLLFLLGSIVVATGLLVYAIRTPMTGWAGVVLGLIMGGTLGNGYDRLVHRMVTDFIAVHFWPVFNVADSAISVGVVLLLLGYVIRSRAGA